MGRKGFFFLVGLITLTTLAFLISKGFDSNQKSKNRKKNENQYTITQPYQFPVTPGSDKWLQLSSHVDKTKICQIPDNIVKKMTTEALVESVLSYPLLPEMFAYNSAKEGYDAVFNQFNGLEELSKRPNAVKELSKIEKSLEPYKDQSSDMGLKELNTRWILKGIKGKI